MSSLPRIARPASHAIARRFASITSRPAPRPTHRDDDAAIGASVFVLGYGMLVLGSTFTSKDYYGYVCWIGPGDDEDRWKSCIAEEAKFLKLYEEARFKGEKGESEKLLKRALRFRADREDLEKRAKQITTAARLRNKEEKARKKRPKDEQGSVPQGTRTAKKDEGS